MLERLRLPFSVAPAAVLAFVLLPSQCLAAAPALVRSISYNSPGNLNDRYYGIAVDRSDDSYVVTGVTGSQLIVQKYSDSGALIWQVIDSTAGAQGRSVAIDKYGSVYVAGLQPSSGNDALLIKYSSAGGELWRRTFDGSGCDDQGYSVAIDPNNDEPVVAGRYCLTQWLILRYQTDGTLRWSQTYYDGSGFDVGAAVAMAANGTAVVAGSDETGYGACGYDIGIRRYDTSGNLVPPYVKYDSGNGDSPAAIALDAAGNIFLGAASTVTNYPCGPWYWHLLKYDSSLALKWNDFPGLEGAIYGVATDTCGGVVAAGSEFVSGQWDWRIRKHDYLGSLLWADAHAGGAGLSDESFAVAYKTNGRLLVAGYETVTGQGENGLIREYGPDLTCAGSKPTPPPRCGGSMSITGAPDGYLDLGKDKLQIMVDPCEKGLVTVQVYDSSGAPVNTLGKTTGGGSVVLMWAGTNASGTLVSAGFYKIVVTGAGASFTGWVQAR